MADEVELIRVAEAARLLGLSRSKVYELPASGELATVKIGRARRIRIEDVRAFIEDHVVGGAR